MKTISLWQPWATLIAAGYKRIETRDWQPRGLRPGQLVAIHAAKHWTADEWKLIAEDPFFRRYITLAQRRSLWSTQHPPLGGVVAIARFQGAYRTEALWRQLTEREKAFGNFGIGRYGWVFSEVRPVAIIPARGQQGLFDWEPPKEIAALYQEPLNAMKAPLIVAEAPNKSTATPAATTSSNSPTRVVHCRKDAFDIYVGRPMPKYPELRPAGWGNPYKDGLDTPEGRQSAIDRYRAWVLTQPQLLARLPELCGKRLGCWCAPAGGLLGNLYGHICHGEVLAALADGALD